MNLELMVERIAREVVSRVNEAECMENSKSSFKEGAEKVLFIVPRQAVRLDYCLQSAFCMFTGCNIVLLTSGCPAVMEKHKGKALILELESEKARESVIEDFSSVSGICLISPGIKLLEDIVNLDDTGFTQYLIINSLIYGKKTKILLDDAFDKLPSKKFGKKIKLMFEQLASMGIEIEFAYLKKEGSCSDKAYSCGLITEKDIIEMAKSGTKDILLQKGSIITPLALDKARETGITILFKED